MLSPDEQLMAIAQRIRDLQAELQSLAVLLYYDGNPDGLLDAAESSLCWDTANQSLYANVSVVRGTEWQWLCYCNAELADCLSAYYTPTADLVSYLSAYFQQISDPVFAWSRAVSMHLALPGLRGFWPMGAVDSAGNAQDQSGHAHHLSYNGNPTYGYAGLAPYIALDGTGDYLSRADEADLDITGTESYIATATRGLTLGGWYWFDTLPGSGNIGIMSKYTTTGNQRSYMLYTTGGVNAAFVVSSDGTATLGRAGIAFTTGRWHFMVGRFTPSAELALFQNGVWYRTTAGVPASIYNGTAAYQVGAFNAGSFLMTGRASMCFLCAAALSDAQVEQLYAQTRSMYGV